MAVYGGSKHAVEGYSESLDHEVREHGVRVLLVEPARPTTPFDANMVLGDTPLPVYAQRRRIFDEVVADAFRDGDDPAVVAKVIATAATDPKSKLRYPTGPTARRASESASSTGCRSETPSPRPAAAHYPPNRVYSTAGSTSLD
jgi:NAD(P)-dependent dehydrogenase (short-subunit alcohol dehydrogenase family)